MIIRNIDIPITSAKRAVKYKGFIQDVISYWPIPINCSKAFDEEINLLNVSNKNNVINAWTIPSGQHFGESISSLLHVVPFYLSKYRHNEDKDLLGAYFSGKGQKTPYIELYISEIEKAAKNANPKNNKEFEQYFKWILTQTTIHEIMHGVMDIYNQAQYYDTNGHYIGPSEQIVYSTEYGRWREESFANAATLKMIYFYINNLNAEIVNSIRSAVNVFCGSNVDGIIRKRIENSSPSIFAYFYSFTKDFMSRQDPEYALGVTLSRFKKIDFSKRVLEKSRGVSAQIQNDWLNEAKSKTPFAKEDVFLKLEKTII